MNKQEIFEFLNQNPACYFATMDGDTPRVRGMLLYKADENGLLFNTGANKDLFKQLQKNPNVELCFVNNKDLPNFIQVRVSGVVVFENDMKIKEQLINDRPFLKPIVEKIGYDAVVVIRVQNLVATPWTMATNIEPKEFIELT